MFAVSAARLNLLSVGLLATLGQIDTFEAFAPGSQNSLFKHSHRRTRSRSLATTFASAASPSAVFMAKPAGSFFNPIPDDNDDEEGEEAKASLENNSDTTFISEQLRNLVRQQKEQQQQPGNFNFSAPPPAQLQRDFKTGETYVGIGGQINDVTKPEYDEQGYTLYANEKTGERKRVFEALVEYPCLFTLKIVGKNEDGFVPDMVSIVAETCSAQADSIAHSVKHNGKWSSVTVHAPVQNAEMLYQLYENVDQDPRVRFKF